MTFTGNSYNSFCIFCVGGRDKEKRQEIKQCNDKYCVFHRFRFANLDWQEKTDEQSVPNDRYNSIG